MKTIIVPTDFSAVSLNAVYYAADMACVINTDLSLIHVCPTPVVLTEVPLPPYTVAELVADTEEKMVLLKEEIKNRTGKKIKINTVVREGEMVSGITEYCDAIDPYAVVMGVKNSHSFERFFFGSKTIAAIKQLSWPVIAVPEDAKFTSLRKIGLACDFRKVAQTIPVKEIKKLVNNFNAQLHVLHVSQQSEDSFDKEITEESVWLKDMLEGLHPKYHFINSIDIETSLAEIAKKIHLDLLITIPKKHNFITKIFRSSHSKELVLHSHLPVMAIH